MCAIFLRPGSLIYSPSTSGSHSLLAHEHRTRGPLNTSEKGWRVRGGCADPHRCPGVLKHSGAPVLFWSCVLQREGAGGDTDPADGEEQARPVGADAREAEA